MNLHSRKNVGKIFAGGVVLLGLLFPALSLAGTNPVVTVGDSSSGGAVSFEPATFSDGGDVGGSYSFETPSGVTVATIMTAVNSGSLGQDQVANGFGAGGSAVTLSEQSVENVKMAAATESVLVNGESMTPLEALKSVSTSPELDSMRVTMPNGMEMNLSSAVSNVKVALATENSTLIGTALNDAAIAVSQALKNGEAEPDLKSAAHAVVDLLDAARNS